MLDHFVHLDDIVIFPGSWNEHVTNVRNVLKRLLENKLFVKAEKCEFHVSSVAFSGIIVETKQTQQLKPSSD